MAMEGTKVETLYIQWRAEYDQFKTDMAQIRTQIDQTKKEVASTKAPVDTMKTNFIDGAMKMAGAAGAAAVAMKALRFAIDELKASIKLAMDVTESESLFETSLGNMADATRAWSESVADALGVNDFEIRRTVGLWYTMGSSIGLTADNALAMSKNLNLLKYDLMSFYNIAEGQSDTMIKAMYSGESEPWKNIGVIMTEQMAKQALYKAGLAEVGQEIDTTTMLYGRYLTVMEQTSVAQGDMSRTIDSPANQLRVLQSTLKDIQLSIGEAFGPIYSVAIPALQSLASWVKVNAEMMSAFANSLSGSKTSGLEIGTSKVTDAAKVGADQWSEYGDKAGAGLDKAAAGVAKLKGMIFGLDEINFEQDNSTSGAGTGGGALTPGLGSNLPEIEALEPALESVDEYKEKMQELIAWAQERKGLLTALLFSSPAGAFVGSIASIIATIKDISSDAIPDYKFLPDNISEETAAKLGPFMELWHDADTTIKEFAWGSKTVTQEAATAITAAYISMAEQVKASIDDQTTESYSTMENFFQNSSALTEEEEAAILATVKSSAEEKKAQAQAYSDEVTAIYQKAADENRSLTEEEQKQVNEIQGKMRDLAIDTMSESADEQRKILLHLQIASDEITARQAADIVKNSLKAKDETVANAIDQADAIIREAKKQMEAGDISKETYLKIVADAEKQRDDTIAAAEESHEKVVDEARKQAGEHVDYVDWETGEIKSKWQVFKDKLTEKWDGFKDWFDEYIAPWFSAAHWKKMFDDLKQSIKDGWKQVEADIKENIKLPELKFPDIKKPKFEVSYDSSWGGGFGSATAKKVGEAMGLPGLPKFDVSWYAAGGLPERGELFIANEAGPELIGKMGSQNAVANQMQIVDGIAEGVSRAMRNAQQDTGEYVFNVYVDGELSHTERISRRNLRAGRTIIPVGG